MADPAEAPQLRTLKTAATRSNKSRVSAGWVAMFLAGLVAFLAFLVASRDTTATVKVAVAKEDIVVGGRFDPDSVVFRSLAIPDSQLKTLIAEKDEPKFKDFVASTPIPKNSLISRTQFQDASEVQALRQMSFPIEQNLAVNGSLKAGDKIDIIDKGQAIGYVATDLKIIAVPETRSGGLGGAGAGANYAITIEVEEDQSISIAKAIDDGKYLVVRSTGAAPVTGELVEPPGGAG